MKTIIALSYPLLQKASIISFIALFAQGCTTYKHVTTHPDGTKTKESVRLMADINNPTRIPFQDVEQPVPPDIPDGGSPLGLSAMADIPTSAGYGFQAASGATFFGNTHDVSSPIHVAGAAMNRAIAFIGTTVLGYKGIDAWQSNKAGDQSVDKASLKSDVKKTAIRADVEKVNIRSNARIREFEALEGLAQ